MSYIYFNGQLVDDQEHLVTADNRGLRYGDGLFETLKVINGTISLADLHFERLFKGLSLLAFELPAFFTPAYLTEAILAVCQKNKVTKAARVRLNIVRGNGGLYDPEDLSPNTIIQSWPLPEHTLQLNVNGLVIDVYPEARKSTDPFANIKSNNYLPYAMAALYAKQQRLNDCLVLNTHDRICDATIANIWWVKVDTIFTPPLSEGGVAGVMRHYLLNKIRQQPAAFKGWAPQAVEQPLTIETLLQADEVFLTNALYGIRWVGQCRDQSYNHSVASLLYEQLIKDLHH